MRKRTESAEAGRNDTEGEQGRLAVLIDADNAHAAIIEALLAEIARFGVASVKRIYGDWTQPQLGSWKKVLLRHSIVPVQQFGPAPRIRITFRVMLRTVIATPRYSPTRPEPPGCTEATLLPSVSGGSAA